MNENPDPDYRPLDAAVEALCLQCTHPRGEHLNRSGGGCGCSIVGCRCTYTPWAIGGWANADYGHDINSILSTLTGVTLRDVAIRIKSAGPNGKPKYSEFGKAHAPLYTLLQEIEAMSSGEALLATGNDAKTVLARIADLIRTRLLEAAMFGLMVIPQIPPAPSGGISVVPGTPKKRWNGYCKSCHHRHFTWGARICTASCGCPKKPRRPRS